MNAANLKWKYANGEVIDSQGRTVAMRADNPPTAPLSKCFSGHQKDLNMQLCAMAPALLALAEAVDEHLGLDDLSLFTDEQQQAILLAQALVRKAGAL